MRNETNILGKTAKCFKFYVHSYLYMYIYTKYVADFVFFCCLGLCVVIVEHGECNFLCYIYTHTHIP